MTKDSTVVPNNVEETKGITFSPETVAFWEQFMDIMSNNIHLPFCNYSTSNNTV